MKEFKVLIIGSGFGGQCAAINLQKQGINNFCILERRNFIGGTWCQNTYPGAAVDVQSPLYSFSFEPFDWSQMFVEQHELEDYTNFVINKYKLREKTIVNTNVERLEWSNEEKRWFVFTNNGSYKAQFVINASGPLSTPFTPDFKGKEAFKGKTFHTNNWDHQFDLKNKKVAVIGSGASAAQVIPAIVDEVASLNVFQRTPHWVMHRPDKIFSKFQRKLLKISWVYKLVRYYVYWSLESRVIAFKYSSFLLKLLARDKALKHIKKAFKDRDDLRKKVTPDYTIGCKRIILSNTLYPAFAKPNTTLFTKEEKIERITETGIVTTKGTNVALDLIVYATGYVATDGVIAYPVVGKDGTTLQDAWNEFPRAYLGTTAPNFPNIFFVTGPNTGIGHTSAIFIIEAQMRYIMRSIKEVEKNKAQAIEVLAEAENSYTTMIHSEMEKTVWKTGNCNSWYQSKSGHVIAMFPGFSFTYLKLAKNFKRKDHKLF